MFSVNVRTNETIFKNINSISVEVISEIQKDLTSYDIRSLVFLIYENGPATALERLTLLQRVTKDVDGNSLNLLHDWASSAQTSTSWRYIFLEALAICQLYGVIRKLGFAVTSVKSYYSPDNINFSIHINPMKKVLYKLCENMNSHHLSTLKKTLLSYDVDVTHYDTSELVFLDLLKQKFISLQSVEKLARIVERIPALNNFAFDLRQIEGRINKSKGVTDPQSIVTVPLSEPTTSTPAASNNNDYKFTEGFDDIFQMLDAEEKLGSHLHLKSDQRQLEGASAYVIKNSNRIGLAYIINEEKFYPSKRSMDSPKTFRVLEDRCGSRKDKFLLQHVLKSYKFEVITDENLDSKEMVVNIKRIIKEKVRTDDSLFLLCILSHGIKGEVFAADSVTVKLEDIQKLLDSPEGKKLWGLPKVLIIQACQVVDDKSPLTLVADGPTTTPHNNNIKNQESNIPKPNYFFRKSDYLIFWATAPEYEAFRDIKMGSIFIQTLCYLIHKKGNSEHLLDIFTKVTSSVKRICTVSQRAQLPIFESTLEKDLFLFAP